MRYVFRLHGLPVLVVSYNTPRRCINLPIPHLHGDRSDLFSPFFWLQYYDYTGIPFPHVPFT